LPDGNSQLADEIEDRVYCLFCHHFRILLRVYLHKSLRLKGGHAQEVLIY